MKKGLLIGAIVIVLIVGLSGALISSKPSPTPTPTPPTPTPETPGLTVLYTNDGFSPKELTIHNGDTVTFKNETADPMWVASDPHPTHTNYPAFDADAGTPSSQSYSFTFTVVGSHGYHDHLNPTKRGKIIVE